MKHTPRTDGGNAALHFIASTIAVAAILGGIAYFYYYFSNAKLDITANDLKVKVVKQGTGLGAKLGDTVTVDYIARLPDGTEFDNSYKRGAPTTIIIGEGRTKVPGWEKGLLGIKLGEKRIITIPPKMAFGASTIKDDNGTVLVPADSIVIYETEAINVQSYGYLQ